MRTFIISLLILCLCFGGAIINTIITENKINQALDILNTASPDRIKAFSDDWEHSCSLLSFTVKRTFLRDIADALQRLDAAAENDDDFEFESAKAALIYKLKELYRSQSFDIKTIL